MKKTKRKGFNFFRSYYDVFNELKTKKDKLDFIEALLDKQFLGIDPKNLKGMAHFAWISQVNSIDNQVKGYEDKTGIKLTPSEGGVETPAEQVQVKEKVQVKEEGEDELYKSINDLEKIYLSDSGILNAIIENKEFPVSSENDVKEKMKEFVLHLKSTGETTKKRKDFNRHFKSWVILKAKKEKENPKRFRLQMEDLQIKGNELDNSATIDIKEQLKLGQ